MMFRFAEEPQVCQGQRYREFSELLLDGDFRFAEESQVCPGQHYREVSELLPDDGVSFCARVTGLSRTALSRIFRIAS